MNKQIIIADSHPIVRLSLRTLFKDEGFNVVGEADNGAEALQLCNELRPGTLVLDAGHQKMDGLHLISELRTQRLPLSIIVFTAQVSGHMVLRYRMAGADGLVYKHDQPSRLLSAIDAKKTGYAYFPDQTFRHNNHHAYDPQDEKLLRTLTPQELMVLQKLTGGHSNKAIAHAMLLNQKTISSYKSKVFQKLNIKTSIELYEIAQRNGLLDTA